jgi:hypothetical protein
MKTKHPILVTPAHGDVKVNQHAARFADRRTRRNRDRATQRRTAIRDSRDYS